MSPRARIAAFCSLFAIGCHGRAPGSRLQATASPAISAPTLSSSAPLAEARSPESGASSCPAPSLALHEPRDGRDAAALATCVRPQSSRDNDDCGMGKDEPALDLGRLDQAVLPFDEATRAHVAEIAKRGETLGRKRRAFGLVGDSMTVSSAFLSDFSAQAGHRPKLAPPIAEALAATIDFYRGQPAQPVQGVWLDSFRASRAAKVGARASWAVTGAPSPLALMVERLSPAVAIVLYGGNDAAFRVADPQQIADDFERDLGRVVDQLEAAGIVPVLNTVARHGHAPGIDDCDAPSGMSNWRIAVQTNAVSARAAEFACRRHLPLVDLRWALDAAPLSGLGHDGVHLNAYRGGPATLDARALQCGNAVRDYVTLRMLRQLRETLGW